MNSLNHQNGRGATDRTPLTEDQRRRTHALPAVTDDVAFVVAEVSLCRNSTAGCADAFCRRAPFQCDVGCDSVVVMRLE